MKTTNPFRVDGTGKISKQNVLNTLMTFGGVAVLLGWMPADVMSELSEKVTAAIMAGVGVVNFVFRTWFNQGSVYED